MKMKTLYEYTYTSAKTCLKKKTDNRFRSNGKILQICKITHDLYPLRFKKKKHQRKLKSLQIIHDKSANYVITY